MTDFRKQKIRQRFSRAAGTYDAHAETQKDLAARLLRELPVGHGPKRILEIGCGTGHFTALLAARYPEARIIALDFAEGMLRLAGKRLGGQGNVSLLCEDGERFLAACTETFDLICANSTLQWFDDLGGALAQIGRLLSDKGCFAGVLFGPRTFIELAQGLSRVFDQEVHLPPHGFPAADNLEEMLGEIFPRFSVQEESRVKNYHTLLELLDHIRKTGTGGGNLPSTLTRGRLHQLDSWFRATYFGYPATYQAFVVRGEK
ncbi:MAG: methyltransferase domain-containing protein [Desulfobulbaceae bacterium]|nr:methyltransferase domain-containing protein [Desulfobulbaceae bacterium]HIJ89753.1 methyltransferase domain-containing protein [Deltaproteobacteria bacterium]